MLKSGPLKTISVALLVLTVIASPLFARHGRSGPQSRTQSDGTRIGHRQNAPSESAPKSGARERISGRRHHNPVISLNSSVRRENTAERRHDRRRSGKARSIRTSETSAPLSFSFSNFRHRRRNTTSPDVIVRSRSDGQRTIHNFSGHTDFRGDHHRRSYSFSRPAHRFFVNFYSGSRYSFCSFYPRHHRKYIFVSLGGYWPVGYSYLRYYWYPCYPYYWYGFYPAAPCTTNYYTYNYPSSAVSPDTDATPNAIRPVDADTFADVREKLAQEKAEEQLPDETLADKLFEEGVNAFEAADYDNAAEKFARSVALAPDDIIIPFACAQALFASGNYSRAAEALRSALANVPPQEDAVFYPRGLYPDDDVLFEQLDALARKAELYNSDADLQLLLGYNLLGAGRLNEALEPLENAQADPQNTAAAEILLDLLAKINTEAPDITQQ